VTVWLIDGLGPYPDRSKLHDEKTMPILYVLISAREKWWKIINK
jgi:hypothetical protein